MDKQQILKNIKELERRLPTTMGKQRMVTKNVITTLKMKLRQNKRQQ